VTIWLQRYGIPCLCLAGGLLLGQQYQIHLGEVQNDTKRIDLHINEGSGSIAVNPRSEVKIDLLWKVWDTLIAHYINPNQLQTDKLTYGAIQGLVRAVGDPYTTFLLPSESQEFHDALAGEFEGIGAELVERDGAVIIERPIKDSPAMKAGLLSNDIITRVNDQDITGQSLIDVVRKIRGPKGTTVTLQIYRATAKDLLEFKIERNQVHVPSVEQKVLPAGAENIGYVALNQFGDSSLAEIKQEFEYFKQQNVAGIILDLRGNGGGYLDGAVDLVSIFVGSGEVVSVHRRGVDADSYTVTGQPMFPTLPLVVLQDAGSASAAEITSGALQDHKRAKIIGTKSFGKGTVQEVYELAGGTSLRVTIAKWHTPSGRDLSKEGVLPDYTVTRTAEDIKAGRDPQLDVALNALLGKDISKYITSK
jgi:carboxyl-terminal processing protease